MLYEVITPAFEKFYQGAGYDGTADPLSLRSQRDELLYPAQALLLIELGDRTGYERLRRAAVEKYGVITSYSIHYTKLYERGGERLAGASCAPGATASGT